MASGPRAVGGAEAKWQAVLTRRRPGLHLRSPPARQRSHVVCLGRSGLRCADRRTGPICVRAAACLACLPHAHGSTNRQGVAFCNDIPPWGPAACEPGRSADGGDAP